MIKTQQLQDNESDFKGAQAQAAGCPHMARMKAQALDLADDIPKLIPISQVDKDCDHSVPMDNIRDWVHNYLAKPHPELGRKGPVCPFVSLSLKLDSIWITQVAEEGLSEARMVEIITRYRDVFFETEPKDEQNKINKAFIVLFPNLGEEGAAIVDKVQNTLKKHFVDMGLMLGEFHANNQSPGLRNPEFKPLRSPIPMLAIRHMVDTDLPFLLPENYPAEERASFLRSYLLCLRQNLGTTNLDLALQGLINAEIEKSMAKAKEQEKGERYCEKCGDNTAEASLA